MSDNAEALRLVIEEGFGKGDLSVADRFAGDLIIEHEYGAPAAGSGAELLKAMILEARGQIPDLVMAVEDIAVDGDKVWARSVGHGTHASTGQRIALTVFDLCRFDGGQIVEHWGVPDRFALLHQAGALG